MTPFVGSFAFFMMFAASATQLRSICVSRNKTNVRLEGWQTWEMW